MTLPLRNVDNVQGLSPAFGPQDAANRVDERWEPSWALSAMLEGGETVADASPTAPPSSLLCSTAPPAPPHRSLQKQQGDKMRENTASAIPSRTLGTSWPTGPGPFHSHNPIRLDSDPDFWRQLAQYSGAVTRAAAST